MNSTYTILGFLRSFGLSSSMPEIGSPSSESYSTGARPRFLSNLTGALTDGALKRMLMKIQSTQQIRNTLKHVTIRLVWSLSFQSRFVLAKHDKCWSTKLVQKEEDSQWNDNRKICLGLFFDRLNALGYLDKSDSLCRSQFILLRTLRHPDMPDKWVKTL